jgi:aminoglycoside phosphotransferase (APT) family kinase protein
VAGPADDPAAAFGPLGRGHAVSAELARLLAPVAADPLLRGDAAAAGAPVSVARHVAAEGEPDGGATVTQLTWCAKWRDPAAGGRFRARSLIYDRRRVPPCVVDFPDDPLLPSAAAPDGPLAGPDVVVLLYLAARRITFRRGEELVGKVKRGRSLARSFARLRAAHAAARDADHLAVAEPVELDAERGVFYQRRLAGRPVRDVIEPANATTLLRGVGAVHAALHALRVDDPAAAGLPVRTPADEVAAMRHDAAWLAFAMPAEAGAAAEVERLLAAELDDLGAGGMALCHGDVALDQVLVAGEGAFGLVDFDDAALADPYTDLGGMLVAMRRDAPQLFAADAAPPAGGPATAYLEGWLERSGASLDARRLRAHRLRAELGALANQVHKARLDADAAAAALARLRDALRDG